MLRKIFYTFWTKFITAVINFLIIIITAKYLGAEGRGTISLVVLGITLTQIFNDIIGGGALVYLVPRVGVFKLFISAYGWTFISSAIVAVSLTFLKLIPVQYSLHVFFLSLLQSLFTINLSLILGRENIRYHNLLNFLQIIFLLAALLTILFVFHKTELISYFISLYISYGLVFLFSFVFIAKDIQPTSLNGLALVIKEIFRNGFFIQMANAVQLLNYRMSYYILDHSSSGVFSGIKLVGIYSTGVAIAESLWLIRQSIAMVQFSRIANLTDIYKSRILTIQLAKLGFWASLCCLIPLLLLPENFYTYLFGPEFISIPIIIRYSSVGIISLSLSAMYSHYFSGIGKNHINTIGSGIGLVFTLFFSFLLIPSFHLTGAAITASLSYLATSVFLFLVFVKESDFKYTELLPRISDYHFLTNYIKNYLK